MIQCSYCGTKNRDGSKYCSDCGARLVPQAGLVCPMCGTPNPVENVFCNKCGARLVPLTATTLGDRTPPPTPIKGLTLPSKPVEPSTREPERDMPPLEPPAPKVEASAREPSVPPPASPTEPPTTTDDWLEQLRTQVTEEAPTLAEAEPTPRVEESAEWLARVRTPEPQELSPAERARRASESIEIAEEDLPDWLRTPPASRARVEPTPSWVTPITPEMEEHGITPPTDSQATPDWLKQVAETTEQTSQSTEQVPAWFKPTQATSEIPPPVPATEEEIPDWLKALKPSEEELRAPSQPATAGETLLEGIAVEKPAWLTTTPYLEPGEEEFLPDWLRTPIPTTAPTTPTPEAIAPEFQGELPDWIAALKPAESPVLSIVQTGPVETTGPLAGLRSVLPLAAAVAEPHALSPSASTHPFAEQARLFEAVFAAPTAAPIARAKKSPRRDALVRGLVYILLAVAIIVPFFVPDVATVSIRTFGTPTADVYDTIQALPPDSLVVVAFDYDPGNIGEMDLQARALVRHLMQRRAKIIAISTLETGPQIAQRVLDDAARAAGNYAYGTNYLNLGYLAGQEAGLRQLAATAFTPTMTDYLYRRPLAQYADLARAQNWRNVALVIELAGSPEVLQKWMEQVQPRVNVKIVAGVSAAAEPRARAYREAKQLSGMLSGLMGAAQYEVLANQRGLAVISIGAQNTANLVFVALIVIGTLVGLFSRGRGKAK